MTKEKLLIEYSIDGLTIKRKEEVPTKRWRAKLNESYWMVSSFKEIYKLAETNDHYDENFYVSGNYFRIKEEAERHKERLLIKQKLEDIALELNDGIEIDWFNCKQAKYYLIYDFETISLGTNWLTKFEGTTYCLNKNFKDEAIKCIGKERLIKYLKGE